MSILEAKGTFPSHYMRLDGGATCKRNLFSVLFEVEEFRGKRDLPQNYLCLEGGVLEGPPFSVSVVGGGALRVQTDLPPHYLR